MVVGSYIIHEYIYTAVIERRKELRKRAANGTVLIGNVRRSLLGLFYY